MSIPPLRNPASKHSDAHGNTGLPLHPPSPHFQQILSFGGPRLLKSQTALKDNLIFPPKGDMAKDVAGVQILLCASQKDVEEKVVRVTPTGVSRAPAGDGSWWGAQG